MNAAEARLDLDALMKATFLPRRTREILHRCYLNEEPQVDVARDLGINESRVSQIIINALKKMRWHGRDRLRAA
jgi:DNA-directed RNA polymerase specialized sigma subunit